MEGFPRSANTFVSVGLRKIIDKKKGRVIAHTHNRLTVQYAIKKQIPTIILIRDPKEAISSLVRYHNRYDRKYISELLNWWLYYYEWFLEKANPCWQIVFFEDIINDFNVLINIINTNFFLGLPLIDNLTEFYNEIKNETEQKYIKNKRSLDQFPLPHNKKQIINDLDDKLDKLDNMQFAQNLYNDLRIKFRILYQD